MSSSNITVVFEDKVVIKNGNAIHFQGDHIAQFDALVESLDHTGCHALQWYGKEDSPYGELERSQTSPNEPVTPEEATAYENFHNTVAEEVLAQDKADALSADPEEVARAERDFFLAETDWIVVKHAEQGTSVPDQWVNYRQALRDLPEGGEDVWSPELVWDNDLYGAVLTGVVYPTKPSL